jgi:RimJ/RimL family protein N-acetyltransferase
VKNPFLVGSKVYLRPLEREDAPVLAPWFNDPEVTRTLLRYRPLSVRAEEAWIEQKANPPDGDDFVLGIALRSNDQLVGGCGLHQVEPRNRQACFGLLIGEKSEWGNGYGSEATFLVVKHAFDTVNLNRVWLQVFENNPRAQRIYEKVGFQVEGRLRQTNFREGRYWDTIVMGLLREEWRQRLRERTKGL